jgi:hypothetical protein
MLRVAQLADPVAQLADAAASSGEKQGREGRGEKSSTWAHCSVP